jgi:hypothetical protein
MHSAASTVISAAAPFRACTSLIRITTPDRTELSA